MNLTLIRKSNVRLMLLNVLIEQRAPTHLQQSTVSLVEYVPALRRRATFVVFLKLVQESFGDCHGGCSKLA